MQESVGGVKRRAAPALEREAVIQDLRRAARRADHVARAHTGREQGLMRVAHGGVRNEQAFFIQHIIFDRLRPIAVEQLLEPFALWRRVFIGRKARRVVLRAFGGGVRHLDLRNVAQHLGRAVLAFLKVEQLGCFVDELGVALARLERWMLQDVRDERDVCLDAADMLLADRAQRLAAQTLKRLVMTGDLNEQRIVIRGDLRADVGIAAVQAHAVAAGRAVGGDLADVGQEVVLGILGRNAALHCIATRDHVRLLADADLLIKQRIALGNQDLRAHQIHTGQFFGNRVLDLDARVHLDEVVIARFVDQELDCTRGYIAHIPRDLDCIRVKTASDFLRHAPRGRKLHDLLVAALKRAVAFKQVDDVAVPVAQHLHFDVLGLDKEFLDKDILVAERLLRLALDLREIYSDILCAVAAAHSAAASSSCCLEQHRIAEFLRECDRVIYIGQRARRARDSGHTTLVRNGLGGQLVAHLL